MHPAKLGKVPDAKLAPTPLFEATFLPYVGLMLGSMAAAAVAIFNAVMVRRYGLALWSLLIGSAGWCAAAWLLNNIEITNASLLVLFARGIGIVIGLILMRSQNQLVRGHQHLDGKTLSLIGSVLVVFVGSILILTNEIFAVLLGVVEL